MLQQTQVATVIPYYQRFTQRFPTLQSLAEAPEDEVMAQWSGLGYYRRARLLHQGVREALATYAGKVPEEATQRRSLPGIGAYTAGAIGSIAFDQPEPAVDGNVMRVLCRLYDIDSSLGLSQTQKQLWKIAADLVQGERPGAFNQALMELGATLCTPRNPRCEQCPLQSHCQAYKNNTVAQRPVPKPRPVVRDMHCLALVIHSQDREQVWLTRSEKALFGGLWHPPLLQLSQQHQARPKARGLARELELDIPRLSYVKTPVQHTLSHRQMNITVAHGSARSSIKHSKLRAFTHTQLAQVGIATLTRKLLSSVEPMSNQR